MASFVSAGFESVRQDSNVGQHINKKTGQKQDTGPVGIKRPAKNAEPRLKREGGVYGAS